MDIKKIITFLQEKENQIFFEQIQQKPEPKINDLQKLVRNNPDKPIKDLLSLIKLQKQNLNKIPAALSFVFTEKGVQQSSSTLLAEYHAEKFAAFSSVADLCCGCGMDLMKIAEGKDRVYAVDLDEDTLQVALFNSQKTGLQNIEFLQQKAEEFSMSVEAIFADPDRRPSSIRKIGKDDIQPTLNELLRLREITPNLAFKLSPAMNYRELHFDCEHTFEFVSENGTLKEMLLCFGALATTNVRLKAVILPQKIMLSKKNISIEIEKIKSFLFEPDPAIIRAGLVQECGAEIGYHLIDGKLALLSGDNPIQSELGRCYRVIEVLPFNLKNLQKYCRENEIGVLVIKTRGFPEKVEDFRKKLKLKGKNRIIVFILRKGDNHLMIFALD
jgi:SAM-dependent methyltransferase